MQDNYEDFKKEVLKLTEIDLNAYKERQMKRRIDTLISRNGFDGYITYTKAIASDAKLRDEFVNYLTINVSEFYRNPSLWDTLEKVVFPNLINQFGQGLKIWSAACSTGDEPYSLAMVLAKQIPLNKGLPDEYKRKYFQQMGDKAFKISDDIKKCVEFKKHNLLKDPYPTGCHLIVCRNVMIYFTEDAKDEIYRKFHSSLMKGGCLFVGNTEQIINYKDIGFTYDKLFFYNKV